MTPELTLPVLLAGIGIGVLAAVYLWSSNVERRRRAWRLLRLFLGR
ncbi:hypothetical protein AB0B74_05830 [Micromonospora parva]